MRLDVLLVKKGFFSSRELAKSNIAIGNVSVNGIVINKPSHDVLESACISLKTEKINPYVSRGGIKLEKALNEFKIDCQGIDVLDLGASTGGFTDCALQHGARAVYAIDVGTDQLSPKLKGDQRVISIENVHIKDLTSEHLNNNHFNLIVADLSFISLTKVFEYFPQFLNRDGKVIVLIKPQFEAGIKHIGKGGIVKDAKVHIEAIININNEAKKHRLFLTKITHAPIYEKRKNIEYLALLERVEKNLPDIESCVKEAFRAQITAT
jgi:23S rRNA (cytidine1920-2'-O)/16S rRNA (cytidine1409-2'-O)-methyltransferase